MRVTQPKRPALHELAVMGRLADLYATLPPERRVPVHQWMGDHLDDLPVIAQVVEEPEPVPMFPEADERQRRRAAGGDA